MNEPSNSRNFISVRRLHAGDDKAWKRRTTSPIKEESRSLPYPSVLSAVRRSVLLSKAYLRRAPLMLMMAQKHGL